MHVLEVDTPTLKAHLNALQVVGAHPLRGVCWSFTHVLLDAEAQLLQATRLGAVSSGLLTVLNPSHWTTGSGEAARTASTATSPQPGRMNELRFSVEQYVREVPAYTAERVGAGFLEMHLESGGAHFEHMRK